MRRIFWLVFAYSMFAASAVSALEITAKYDPGLSPVIPSSISEVEKW